jgi:hypothetical protein
MSLLQTIEAAWYWRGIAPAEVVAQNQFGNVIVRTAENRFWRIMPEELSAQPVAESAADFHTLWSDPNFLEDWNMTRLVEMAQNQLGTVPAGRCYCLKIPGVLGGEYAAANMGTITMEELLSASGDMARQIADVPDGGQVKLTIKR